MQMDLLLERTKPGSGARDRIRQHTPTRFNQRIDQATIKRVWNYARRSPDDLTARVEELDREWDLERMLEIGAGGLALSGVLLSGLRGRRWLLLSAATLGSLLQHALTRGSVLSKILRGCGVRTRREIEAEKYAIRMLRGDFDGLKGVAEETHRAIEALRLSRP